MTSLAPQWPSSLHVRFRPLMILLAGFATLASMLSAAPFAGHSSQTPAPAPRLATGTGGALSPALARLAATEPQRRVEVIIQLSGGQNIAEGRALVRSLGGRPGLDLHIINGLSAQLTAGAAGKLAASPLVRAVSLNAPVKETTLVNFQPSRLASTFDASVNATNLWNFSTGQGVGVAVIDTGVTGNLPDFQASQTNSTSRVTASVVIDPNATTASDTYGHGTDVAGLVAGNGGFRAAGDPMWGKYAGTAPDANVIGIKISDDTGAATTLDAIYGLQFAVDHQSDYNIRVINLSFRSLAAQSYTTDPVDAAVEQAWLHGIVVVAAAGNLGTAPDAVSYAPANDPYVITVGALDEQGTKSTTDDVITSWSSQGTTEDGITKPDVYAPGAHIVSTLAPNSAFATLCPTCIIGGSYFQASGTSMAAPIVSGLAADLIAAHPSWTPDMVKGALVSTAVALPAGGSEVSGIAATNASGSQLVSNQGLTPSTLIDPTTGSIDYNAASWSSASWSTATGTLSASWSSASWSCLDCTATSSTSVNTTSASWSTVGWATKWG